MALSSLFSNRMKRQDMIVMMTTLSWMLSSGISVKSGVDKLLEDPNNKMNRNSLLLLHNDLEEGKQLSECFRDHEDVFGTGYWRQIDAAEQTGKVAECLLRITSQLENDGDLMSKVRGAVTYPAVIVLFALVAGYYMFTTIVPQMGEMMGEFGVEMPALTVAVMVFADYLMSHYIFIAGILVGSVLLIRYLISHQWKFGWCKLLTRLPFVGPISVNMNYSLVYTLLSDMIENGSHIVEALRVAAGSATNAFIMSELLSSADSMEREGLGLTEALVKSSTMPADDKLMLQIGSDTGREIELLSNLSSRRREAAYGSVNALMEVLPTLVLLVVAAVVGVMVIAIYMPMISMATEVA